MHIQFLTQIVVDYYAFCYLLHAGGSGVRVYEHPALKLLILAGRGRSILFVAWPTGIQPVVCLLGDTVRLPSDLQLPSGILYL